MDLQIFPRLSANIVLTNYIYLLQRTLGNRPVEEIKLATLAKSVFMNEHSFDSAKLAAGAAIDLGRRIQMTAFSLLPSISL